MKASELRIGNSNGQRWFTIAKENTNKIENINFEETPF